MLKTRGFVGDSRQAGPVRPVYNADQPITALKGTGIRTLSVPLTEAVGFSRGMRRPERSTRRGPWGGVSISDEDAKAGDVRLTTRPMATMMA